MGEGRFEYYNRDTGETQTENPTEKFLRQFVKTLLSAQENPLSRSLRTPDLHDISDSMRVLGPMNQRLSEGYLHMFK